MRVGTPSVTVEDGITTVSAAIRRAPLEPVTISYSLPANVIEEQALDAFFVLAHRVALVTGARLEMPGPVSARLLEGARAIEDVFMLWRPDLYKPVEWDVTPRTSQLRMPTDRILGACYSGGVDSMFSLLNPPRSVGIGVFVHGFDINLTRTHFHRIVSARLTDFAARIEVEMLQVTTNVRELMGCGVTWGGHLHGPAIASFGILLGQVVDELLLPASSTSRHADRSNGSHQLTDRHLGTEYLAVNHHGTWISRIEKTAAIAEHPGALQALRPCYRTRTDYNCGECSKCDRTSRDLAMIGVRTKVRKNFGTWKTRRELVDSVKVTTHLEAGTAKAALDFIGAHGGNEDFRKAFTASLADFEVRRLNAGLSRVMPMVQPGHTDKSVLADQRRTARATRLRWTRQRLAAQSLVLRGHAGRVKHRVLS